ncbi:MAG: hypothetical protein ACP8RL_04410 [cyanobacterium endosymbiont of Rhopalodia inflata]
MFTLTNLLKTVLFKCYLFDTGVINNAIDKIVENWGSFKILNFNLGIEHLMLKTLNTWQK